MLITKFKTMLKQRRQREDLYSTAAYWDSKALELKGQAVSMWPNNELNKLYQKEQLDLIVDTLPSVDGKVLLDLGCGTGRLSRWFADRGAEVTGIDFSGGALAIARKKTNGINPAYRQLSMFDIDDTNIFDSIFSWGSLTAATKNSAELKQVLERLFRALKPGGSALFLEPVHRGFLHRVLDMNVSEFISVMKEAGFEIRFVRAMHYWPMRLFLAYLRWPGFITVPLYHFGQFIMRIPGFRTMGDYQAIYAVRR